MNIIVNNRESGIPSYHEMVEWRKEHFKKEIILKACKIFNRKGYQNATMNDVARELGISKPTLYYYVKSKDDIVKMIVDYTVMAKESNTKQIYKDISGLSHKEAIKTFIGARLKLVDELQDLYIFRNQLTSVLPRDERVKLYISFGSFIDSITEIIEAGVNAGVFRTSDTRFICLNISYMITSWALRRWYLRRFYTIDQYTELLIDYTMKMLGFDYDKEKENSFESLQY
jgi:TetR/AcrR family transcriptional regulator, cholesterol catabolism regulator